MARTGAGRLLGTLSSAPNRRGRLPTPLQPLSLGGMGMGLSIQPLDHPGRRAGLLATANAPHRAIFRLRLPVGEASLLRNIALNSSPNAA
jgi:hypothetical protein